MNTSSRTKKKVKNKSNIIDLLRQLLSPLRVFGQPAAIRCGPLAAVAEPLLPEGCGGDRRDRGQGSVKAFRDFDR